MTTWTTFETLDEMSKTHGPATIYVDQLGMHGYTEDDRTRFIIAAAPKPDMTTVWSVMDLKAEDGQERFATGTMKECVQWMAARVLYGA